MKTDLFLSKDKRVIVDESFSPSCEVMPGGEIFWKADAACNRGWTAGVLTGTLVTTFLLGGGIFFVIWVEWLRWCA